MPEYRDQTTARRSRRGRWLALVLAPLVSIATVIPAAPALAEGERVVTAELEIVGTPRVGELLTADPHFDDPGWPQQPDWYMVEWWIGDDPGDLDSMQLVDSWVDEYRPQGEQVGEQLRARLIAEWYDEYSSVELWSAPVTIQEGEFTPPVVEILGSGKVGEQLMLDFHADLWQPIQPEWFEIRWFIDGVHEESFDDISGFTPPEWRFGQEVHAEFTAFAEGFQPYTVTTDSVSIIEGDFDAFEVWIEGDGYLGSVFELNYIDPWTAGAEHHFEWFISDDQWGDGESVGVGSSFEVPDDEAYLGRWVRAEMTKSSAGQSLTKVSNRMRIRPHLTVDTVPPVIHGDVRPGVTLTVDLNVDQWSMPMDRYDVTWAVEVGLDRLGIWNVDASELDDTDFSYTVDSPWDVGDRLYVKVTGWLDGYAVATSESEHLLIEPAQFATGPLTVSGEPKVDGLLSVDDDVFAAWSPNPLELTWPHTASVVYEWHIADEADADEWESLGEDWGYYPGGADAGRWIRLKATVSADGYETAEGWSDPVQIQPGAFPGTVPPSISGLVAVGMTVGVWTNHEVWPTSPDWVDIAWFVIDEDDEVHQAGTGENYVVTAGDLGKRLFVRVTGHREGYVSASVDSEAVTVVSGSLPNPGLSAYVVGSGNFGDPLTVAFDDEVPEGAVHTYAWWVGVTPVGSGPSYTPVEDDYGSWVYAEVTRWVDGKQVASGSAYGMYVAWSDFAKDPAYSGAGSISGTISGIDDLVEVQVFDAVTGELITATNIQVAAAGTAYVVPALADGRYAIIAVPQASRGENAAPIVANGGHAIQVSASEDVTGVDVILGAEHAVITGTARTAIDEIPEGLALQTVARASVVVDGVPIRYGHGEFGSVWMAPVIDDGHLNNPFVVDVPVDVPWSIDIAAELCTLYCLPGGTKQTIAALTLTSADFGDMLVPAGEAFDVGTVDLVSTGDPVVLGGTITGSVADEQGEGIKGIAIQLLDPDTAEPVLSIGGTFGIQQSEFSTAGVPAGEYIVRFSDVNSARATSGTMFEPAYLADPVTGALVTSFADAARVTVEDGETLEIAEVRFRVGGVLTGSVMVVAPQTAGSDQLAAVPYPGTQLPGVQPQLYFHNGDSWEPLYYASSYFGVTAEEFTMAGLPTGDYCLYFAPDPRVKNMVRFQPGYRGGPGVTSCDEAELVHITAGEVTSGVDSTVSYLRPDAPHSPAELVEGVPAGDLLDVDTVSPGQLITIHVGADYAGQWVAVYAHSTPTAFGSDLCWFQVAADGTIIGPMPAVETGAAHTIVVQDADGEIISTGHVTVDSAWGATPQPELSGAARVGEPMTVDLRFDEWQPEPVGFSLRWYVGGVLVQEGLDHYTPTPADAGKDLVVEVTASAPDHPEVTVASEATEIEPAMFGFWSVSLPAQLHEGEQVAPTINDPSPAGASYAYQWYRMDEYGDPWAGGPGTLAGELVGEDEHYTPSAADVGKYVYVSVTKSALGYIPSATISMLRLVSAAPKGTLEATAPEIDGIVRVGETLTPVPPVVAGDVEGVSIDYRWSIRDFGTTDAESFTVPANAVDAELQLSAVITADGYDPLTVSSEWVTIAPGVITASNPGILGTPKVGQAVEAVAPVVEGDVAGVEVAYAWFVGDAVEASGTGQSYTPVASDADESLVVVATITAPGYGPLEKSSEPQTVAKGTFTTMPEPTISGSKQVGGKLTADPGAWSPKPTLKYQWYRSGKAIKGATSKTYTVVNEDSGKSLQVVVTASKPGYVSVSKKSAAAAIKAASKFTATPVPTISGTAKMGATLTAKAGTWKPSATLKYQWFRSGKAIEGAAKSTYKLQAADVGKTITVKVTGSKTGYLSVTKTSKATGKVAAGVFSKSPTPTISGTAKVGSKLTAKAGTWSPKPTLKYQWYRSGKAIKGATGSSYTLVGADAGKTITVKVTGSLAGYTSKTVTSKATKKVAAGTITSVKPTISGTLKAGSTLTVNPGAWKAGASKVSFKYQWLVDGKAVKGATKSTWKVPASAKGKKVTVKVTGSATGYTAKTVTSAAKTIAK